MKGPTCSCRAAFVCAACTAAYPRMYLPPGPARDDALAALADRGEPTYRVVLPTGEHLGLNGLSDLARPMPERFAARMSRNAAEAAALEWQGSVVL